MSDRGEGSLSEIWCIFRWTFPAAGNQSLCHEFALRKQKTSLFFFFPFFCQVTFEPGQLLISCVTSCVVTDWECCCWGARGGGKSRQGLLTKLPQQLGATQAAGLPHLPLSPAAPVRERIGMSIVEEGDYGTSIPGMCCSLGWNVSVAVLPLPLQCRLAALRLPLCLLGAPRPSH